MRIPELPTSDLPAGAPNGAAKPAGADGGGWFNRRLDGRTDTADAPQMADAMADTWLAIQAALTPIIGQRGVAALYERSLYLAGVAHPWLVDAQGAGEHTPPAFGPLKTVLARQTDAAAAAGGEALLHSFHGLLVSLVGAALTDRLLQPVWTTLPAGPQTSPRAP